jgi:hypothetical protein
VYRPAIGKTDDRVVSARVAGWPFPSFAAVRTHTSSWTVLVRGSHGRKSHRRRLRAHGSRTARAARR